MEAWLEQLRAVAPGAALDEVAVIGGDYWPLPWYLRAFEKIGYWQEPPPDLAKFPLVFAMPESAEAVMREPRKLPRSAAARASRRGAGSIVCEKRSLEAMDGNRNPMKTPGPLPDARHFSHEAMNTTFSLRLRGVNEETARGMARECFDQIDLLETRLSRFIEGSDVSRINCMAGRGNTLSQ